MRDLPLTVIMLSDFRWFSFSCSQGMLAAIQISLSSLQRVKNAIECGPMVVPWLMHKVAIPVMESRNPFVGSVNSIR